MVVSDCSGNRLQVTDGQDGLLCPLEPAVIAQAVGALLDDPDLRRRLGRAAIERTQPGRGDAGGLLEALTGGDLV